MHQCYPTDNHVNDSILWEIHVIVTQMQLQTHKSPITILLMLIPFLHSRRITQNVDDLQDVLLRRILIDIQCGHGRTCAAADSAYRFRSLASRSLYQQL